MGLFDQIIGGLAGNSGGSPVQSMIMGLLSGQQGGAQQGWGQQSGGQQSGLGALIGAFEQAGLGNLVQSWIGNGANQSVSPGQLQSVLGEDRVQAMATQSNMAPQDFLSQLSQHLPNAVDGMTPGGQLPDEGTRSV